MADPSLPLLGRTSPWRLAGLHLQAPPRPSWVGLEKVTGLQPPLGARDACSYPAGLTGLMSCCEPDTGDLLKTVHRGDM